MSKEAPICNTCGEYADGCRCLVLPGVTAQVPPLEDYVALKIFHAVNHGNMALAAEILDAVRKEAANAAVNDTTCIHHTDAERKSVGAIRCPVCLSKSEAEREKLAELAKDLYDAITDEKAGVEQVEWASAAYREFAFGVPNPFSK